MRRVDGVKCGAPAHEIEDSGIWFCGPCEDEFFTQMRKRRRKKIDADKELHRLAQQEAGRLNLPRPDAGKLTSVRGEVSGGLPTLGEGGR